MRYTFFEFQNFKGIRKARLSLSDPLPDARVYTLVGLNESGKTTILEAIDHFQPSEDDEVSPKMLAGWTAPAPHTLIPIGERTNFDGEVSINCGIALDDADVAAIKRELHKADGFRLEDLPREIAITDRYLYESSRYQERLSTWTGLYGTGYLPTGSVLRRITHAGDRKRWQLLAQFIRAQLPPIWYFPNFLFDFPAKILLEPAPQESASNRFYRALFQDVLDALDRNLDIKTHIVDRYNSLVPGDKDNLQQVLLEAGRHVSQTIAMAWNTIFVDNPLPQKRVVLDVGHDLTLDSDSEEATAPSQTLWVRFRVEDADGLFSIAERSLGFRWFFVYLMLTTYRGQGHATGGETLFLFDEPASNLHPNAQTALLESFRVLSRRATIIYTTHSHHLIEPTWLPTSYVIANTGLDAAAMSTEFTAQRTNVTISPYRQFAADHPDQAHYFQPILDVLRYAPSRLELVPEAVMVEGVSDFYLLAYYDRVVLRAAPADALNIMPGGGAGTLDDLLQLYIGWSRPFVALLDSDNAGVQQLNRYVDKFGQIVKPHLIALAEASGQTRAKGIESLLTEADRVAFQHLVDASATEYRKKTFALGVQEALVSEAEVPLTTSAVNALHKVRETLRVRLRDLSDRPRGNTESEPG
jgi:AAA domain, putative AbiEii toxin, Type IV TA system/AAA ATPase domain